MYLGRLLLYFVITLPAFVFCMGWLLGNEQVVRVFPRFAGMVPTTALALMLLGWALIDAATDRASEPNGTTYAVVLVVAATALLNLVIVLSGYARGIDSILFPQVEVFHEIGMSPATAICLLLGCVGLAFLKTSNVMLQKLYVVAALFGLLIATSGLVGYLIDVQLLYRLPLLAGMALHTATAMAALFSALLLLRADAGWHRLFRRT